VIDTFVVGKIRFEERSRWALFFVFFILRLIPLLVYGNSRFGKVTTWYWLSPGVGDL